MEIFGNVKNNCYLCDIKEYHMTKIEKCLFDLNESMFGEEYASNFFNVCSTAFASFVYILYLFTLPIQFIFLCIRNFIKMRKEKSGN